MRGSDDAAGPRSRDRVLAVPLIVALVALAAVSAWLGLRDPEDRVTGNVGGTVVLIGAAFACYRVSRLAAAVDPIRGFWRLWAWSAAVFIPSTIGAMIRGASGEPGMPLYEAVPTLASLTLAMLAFRHVPVTPRSRLDWARLLLDGAAVTVAGSVFFGYFMLHAIPAGTSATAGAAAAIVGVGCLLALVVFGKAAVSPEGRVDPAALGILAFGPTVGLVAVVLFLGGTELGMLLLSVLGYPLVGLGICLAAYRQGRVLSAPPRRLRWSFADPLQFLAVAVTAGLVIIVSARDLDLRGRAVIIGAVLIAAIIVARQLLSLRENTLALRGIRRQQAELERLLLTDNLTGLPNRTGFVVALTERLATEQPATALLIDIDDFKMVNDTLGPSAADQLLRQVGRHLADGVGPGECVARLGGDEFAVLLPLDDPASADAAATRFQATVGRPVLAGQQQFLLHASVGVAIAEPGETADEVLRNADIAMYAAKESGKASWVRFEARMRHDMTAHARLAGELHDAILGGQLRLLYQPVYDLVTGRMHGAEALVRWQHPSRGFVSPADFIPVAEKSGLIVPLGAWVLREACSQLARWQAALGADAVEAINVNVAVRQLRETGFVDEVAAVLSDTGLCPANLIIEVTESSVADGPQVTDTLRTLHDMGVRLALDDFGTGQSSLSLLRAFPVDVLKLDKSFVDGIADGADRGRLAVAAAVAQLVEYLQLKAVAEGIESEAQLIRLRDMGYRYGQGYFMARPLPPGECAELMAAAPQAAFPH
ncbi:bifunctional diguanylate cyclase/phosphodiesterase [Actinoplanes sp. NEAU-A12]|uniref:Bifunctional diguanylate cyclase/phosphodiesterase n=1 Tax=Actinoplanes sandaracinus TaxID=3045177 RepID=A0ABT6WYB6_9ACTN|nr:bifunctional diguanylate cyclase/phosphodiesterase [Actinoplanes sandaracinus]MDI6104729.1 bifunctional diguanylate cyclase/phosphodiesterase [Actinoplanes sandaracinus]